MKILECYTHIQTISLTAMILLIAVKVENSHRRCWVTNSLVYYSSVSPNNFVSRPIYFRLPRRVTKISSCTQQLIVYDFKFQFKSYSPAKAAYIHPSAMTTMIVYFWNVSIKLAFYENCKSDHEVNAVLILVN